MDTVFTNNRLSNDELKEWNKQLDKARKVTLPRYDEVYEHGMEILNKDTFDC